MLMLKLKQQKQIWGHLQCAVPSNKHTAGIVLFNFPAIVGTNKSTKMYGMLPAPGIFPQVEKWISVQLHCSLSLCSPLTEHIELLVTTSQE